MWTCLCLWLKETKLTDGEPESKPIAIETAAANSQHYEVGTGVLQACLGPRMKYSACLYPKGSETLGQAEIAMLESYVVKAELKDGMRILDLGFVHPLPHSTKEVANEQYPVVDGVQQPYTSQKDSPTPKSRPFPTPRPKRSTSTAKPRRKASPT